MSEVFIFIIVAVIAVAAAIAMLLSENPVHSALFLIVNFACVAFFYLMLDAPFLAMIQIAVYAGAIMVLFLFVIMLLGAEKLTDPVRRFTWLAPAAIGLAAAFLLVVGLSIINGNLVLSDADARDPMLRVVHAVPDQDMVDVYANNELIASNVAFGTATDFKALPPGEYDIALTPAGTTGAVLMTTVQLEGSHDREANTYSLIAYGGSAATPVQFSPLLTDNLETVNARTARLEVFNGYDKPLNLVDYASPFDEGETDPAKRDDKVVFEAIQPGTLVELPLLPETQSLQQWGFSEFAEDGNGAVIFRLDNPELYAVKRDTSQLMVVAQQENSLGELRPVTIPLVNEAVPSFGSPQAIGELLFSRFMLPFQLIAVLLLAAMVGAIVLTHKEDFVPRRRDVRRRVMKPLAAVISDQVGHDVIGQPDESLPQLPEQPEAAGD